MPCGLGTTPELHVNDHDSSTFPTESPKASLETRRPRKNSKVPGEHKKVPVAVIARTGFFVLCSVFKEHSPGHAGPREQGEQVARARTRCRNRSIARAVPSPQHVGLSQRRTASGADNHPTGLPSTVQISVSSDWILTCDARGEPRTPVEPVSGWSAERRPCVNAVKNPPC